MKTKQYKQHEEEDTSLDNMINDKNKTPHVRNIKDVGEGLTHVLSGALTTEKALLQEAIKYEQKIRYKFATELNKRMEITQDIEHSLKPTFSLSLFIRIFIYHLFFPLTIPIVILVEGLHLATAMQFLLCLAPITCFKQIFKGYFTLLISQYFVAPLSTVILIFYVTLLFYFNRFPCLSITNVNIMAALGYHILRILMISLKYAMAPNHEVAAVLKKPFHTTAIMWSNWHLRAFIGTDINGFRHHIHKICLRHGIDSPLHENKRFGRQGFNFTFECSLDKDNQHLFKKNSALYTFFIKRNKEGQRILPLSTLPLEERKKLPVEMVKIIQQYYCMVTKLNEHDEQDYNEFINYFSIEILSKSKNNGIKNIEDSIVHLRVDVRELLVRAINKNTYRLKYSSTILWCVAIVQSLIPWVVAICTNPNGFGDYNAAKIGREAYQNFMTKSNANGNSTSSSYVSISNYDCARFNSSSFPVIEGVKYSIAGENPFWQGATVFMTISSTFLHMFYAYVIYTWLTIAIADYKRRHDTMKLLDDFIKKRYFYEGEYITANGNNDNGIEKMEGNDDEGRTKSQNFDMITTGNDASADGVIAVEEDDKKLLCEKFTDIVTSKVNVKCTKPLLLLDSPENVYNFCKARKLLKEVGMMYHVRMQALAFFLLVGFFVCIIGMVYVSIILNFGISPVLKATATLLFMFGTGGVLEMVRQGGNANYEISRCLTHIDDQCINLFEKKEKAGELHLERTEATAFAIGACRDELRVEWQRHPMRIFFLPAGAIVYRVIFTLMFLFLGFIVRDYYIDSL